MNGFFKFTLIIFLFLGLVIGWLGFGERGFIHLYRMDKERQAYLERIDVLEGENEALFEEIQRLRTDKSYMETLARRELDLIKDHEILYRFSREHENQPAPGTVGNMAKGGN